MAGMICKRCGEYVSFVTFANARAELCSDCLAKQKAEQGDE